MRSWLVSAAVAAVVLFGRSALAQEARESANPEGAEPGAAGSMIDDEARYAWLKTEISHIEGPTERWVTGWTWGFAWLAAGETSLAFAAPKPGLQADSGVGAFVAGLGFLNMLIQPNTMADATATLDAYDTSTAMGRYERRRHAEYLLRSTAAEERFEHSLIPFTLSTVVNVAANAVLIEGYHQDLAGWLSMGAGEIVILIQMFSRPYSATRAWERYQKSYHPFPPSEIPPDQVDIPDKLHMSFVVGPTGVGARGEF